MIRMSTQEDSNLCYLEKHIESLKNAALKASNMAWNDPYGFHLGEIPPIEAELEPPPLIPYGVRIPCSGVVLIFPLMHHHLHVQCDKTCTHPWHKATEYKMKKTKSSESAPSRVMAGFSADIMGEGCSQKLAPLSTRPWDSSDLFFSCCRVRSI